MLSPARLIAVDPNKLTTGTPIQSASKVVV